MCMSYRNFLARCETDLKNCVSEVITMQGNKDTKRYRVWKNSEKETLIMIGKNKD